MAVKDVFKVNRKTFFNPRAWIGYDFLKEHTQTLWAFAKTVFFPPPVSVAPGEVTTFEQTVKRLNLSETDLQNIDKNYLMFAYVFAGLGLFLLIIAIYFLFDASFLGCILALSASAVLFAQAFRFHFWHFQIKFRKLGCTFAEWRSGRPNNEGNPS